MVLLLRILEDCWAIIGLIWQVIYLKALIKMQSLQKLVWEFLSTISPGTPLSRSPVEGGSCGRTYLTWEISPHLPLLPARRRQPGLPRAVPVAQRDVASAEVKHSRSSLSRAFSMCRQCAGENDFKLLSARLPVHASQSHSDKPVTTQRRPLEKSSRAGL